VVNWFTSSGYLLREFHRVLRPGGTLLRETMHRDGIVPAFPMSGSANVARAGPDDQDLMIDTSTFEAESGRLLTERIVIRDREGSKSRYSVRLPAPTEFRAWLHDTGFNSVRFASRQGQPLTLDSRRLIILAQTSLPSVTATDSRLTGYQACSNGRGLPPTGLVRCTKAGRSGRTCLRCLLARRARRAPHSGILVGQNPPIGPHQLRSPFRKARHPVPRLTNGTIPPVRRCGMRQRGGRLGGAP
jgi:hypothetical protein